MLLTPVVRQLSQASSLFQCTNREALNPDGVPTEPEQARTTIGTIQIKLMPTIDRGQLCQK